MVSFKKEKLQKGQLVSYMGVDHKKYEAPVVSLLSTQCPLLDGMMIMYNEIVSARMPENGEEFTCSTKMLGETETKFYKYIADEWILERKSRVPNGIKARKK